MNNNNNKYGSENGAMIERLVIARWGAIVQLLRLTDDGPTASAGQVFASRAT